MAPLQGNYPEPLPAQGRAKRYTLSRLENDLDKSRAIREGGHCVLHVSRGIPGQKLTRAVPVQLQVFLVHSQLLPDWKTPPGGRRVRSILQGGPRLLENRRSVLGDLLPE